MNILRKIIDYDTEYYQDFYNKLINKYGLFIAGSCIEETETLIHINTSKLINNGFPIQYLVLDKQEKKISIVAAMPQITNENLEAVNALNTKECQDWQDSKIIVYPINICIEIILFRHKNNIYIATENYVCQIQQENYKTKTQEQLCNLIIELCGIDRINKLTEDDTKYYVIQVAHNKIRKITNMSASNGLFINHDLGFVGYNHDQNHITLKSVIEKNSIYSESVSDNNDMIERTQRLYFSCMDELIAKLESISYSNKINKRISILGYQIKVIGEDPKIYNIYTEIYQTIVNSLNIHNLSDNYNIYQMYLDLYQKNKLNNMLPYISKYPKEIIYRIDMSMKTITKEIVNIYHATRNKKNKELYDALTDNYRKILFDLHGLYIDDRREDFKNTVTAQEKFESIDSKSISVHDVYYYIKYMSFDYLKQIYNDRQLLLEKEACAKYLCKDCIFTLTQTKLMFHVE
jgi:hypothetical protein